MFRRDASSGAPFCIPFSPANHASIFYRVQSDKRRVKRALSTQLGLIIVKMCNFVCFNLKIEKFAI